MLLDITCLFSSAMETLPLCAPVFNISAEFFSCLLTSVYLNWSYVNNKKKKKSEVVK